MLGIVKIASSTFGCLFLLLYLATPALGQTTSTEDLDAKYYRKNLELARFEYESALRANRQIPNLNSKLTLLRLKNQVLYATEMLKWAEHKDEAQLHQVHLQYVENELRTAEQQLNWAKQANESNPGLVRDDDLKRLELRVELAEIALERAKQPDVVKDPIRHLQWQLDRMRSEILSMQVELERIKSSR